MAKESAGLLLYRLRDGRPEVFLVHPGGPFWKNKDLGAWSIPKGEVAPGEDRLDRAKQEFQEETGATVTGTFVPLQPVRQAGGKIVHAWAVEGDCEPTQIVSNTFEIEWPPRSGRRQAFPEVDRAAWFDLAAARERILHAQVALLDELETRLRGAEL